jgi:serine/threonine-protein kinase
LVDRSEIDAAAFVLQNTTSATALVFRADLAEMRGELPSALSLIERALLIDFDHYGARERLHRYRAKLGYASEAKSETQGATIVTREPDAPFDLLREVGRGGAGVVYEAVDRELGRHVALKIYHQPDRDDRAQLTHEATVAVALAGPGIVRVFDVDPEHGWIALEWAALGTLREHIRSRNESLLLPVDRLAIDLARALARVHAKGWVHHDVKPGNVLVKKNGKVLIADFGTAARIGQPSPPGSLGYLSPERLAGRASDPRDDVYGFGRILEEILDALEAPNAPHTMTNAQESRFRALASACTGPDASRPADARDVLARLG